MQLLTGAREGELLRMRGIDLHTKDKIWTATPEDHKTAWRDIPKTVYFGPQAQRILKEFLNERPVNQPLFSAAAARAEHLAKLHEARKVPLKYGNRPGTNRKPNPRRTARDYYDNASYRHAIMRACQKAFPPPEHLARIKGKGKRTMCWETDRQWEARLGPERWNELRAWQRIHHWHPHRLRHNAATNFRKEFGLEAASIILGHGSLPMTELYAEMNDAKAKKVIRKIG